MTDIATIATAVPVFNSVVDALEEHGHCLGEVHQFFLPKYSHPYSDDFDEAYARHKIQDKATEAAENTQKLFAPTPFTIGGKVFNLADYPCKLFVKSDADSQQDIPAGELWKPDVDVLEKASTPAMFGDLKENQTAYDTTVGLASELKAPQLMVMVPWLMGQSKVEWFHREMESITALETIRKQVQDNFNKRVQFVVNNLNIYRPGGFVKAHFDTPTDASMIGSLVVCLPSKHKGGELVVQHEDVEQVYDFATGSDDNNTLQWAAFFCDCIHEVRPVTQGRRVTLTFAIIEHDEASQPPEARNELYPIHAPSQQDYMRRLDKLEQQLPALITESESVGLLLSHKYTTKGIDLAHLKGRDQLIVDRIRTKYPASRLCYVIVYYTRKDYRSDWKCSTNYSLKVYSFNDDDIKCLANRTKAPVNSNRHYQFFDVSTGLA